MERGYSYCHVLRIVDKLESMGYCTVIRCLGHPTYLDFMPLLDLFLALLHEEQEALRPARPATEERARRRTPEASEPETAPDPFVVAAREEREQIELELRQREVDFGEVCHDLSRQVTRIQGYKQRAAWDADGLRLAMRKADVEASRATSSRFGLFEGK